MAKPPGKRRGITLGARADSASPLDLLSVQPSPSPAPESDPTRPAGEFVGQLGASAGPLTEQLEELRRLNGALESRWRDQAEQLERQLQALTQQRDQIAQQTRQLLALEQSRAASARKAVLLGLLALAGVAAVGFHGWPWLRAVAQDVHQVSAGVTELAPQLAAVRGEMVSLSSDKGEMGSAVASLREDVAGVRSDLGSLRQAVDTLSGTEGAVPASAGNRRSNRLPHTATTMNNPYRTMRPMMPW